MAAQMESPIPGKLKNCDEWAQYEPPNSSTTSALCHGGYFKGAHFEPCPVRSECKSETMGIPADGRRHLPIMNPRSMPATSAFARPALAQPAFRSSMPTSLPSSATRPAVQQQLNQYVDQSQPRPVMPPTDYPGVMQTPYVASMDMGGSPTFLPVAGESTFDRLAKNVIQGAVTAMAWQVFSYLRSTDIFKFFV